MSKKNDPPDVITGDVAIRMLMKRMGWSHQQAVDHLVEALASGKIKSYRRDGLPHATLKELIEDFPSYSGPPLQ